MYKIQEITLGKNILIRSVNKGINPPPPPPIGSAVGQLFVAMPLPHGEIDNPTTSFSANTIIKWEDK